MVSIRPRVQHVACNCSRHGGTFPVLARAVCAKVRVGIGGWMEEGKYFPRPLARCRRRCRRRRRRCRKRIVQRLEKKAMKVTGIKEMGRGPSLQRVERVLHLLRGGKIILTNVVILVKREERSGLYTTKLNYVGFLRVSIVLFCNERVLTIIISPHKKSHPLLQYCLW